MKEPKYYLWDWSLCPDEGARNENFIASHLLKAVQFWTDSGLGDYGLFYVRDKSKREVNFLVTRNEKPWFLVEVKSSGNKHVSEALHYFHRILETKHAFQVVMDMPFVNRDCFEEEGPIRVPARSLFSQLL